MSLLDGNIWVEADWVAAAEAIVVAMALLVLLAAVHVVGSWGRS